MPALEAGRSGGPGPWGQPRAMASLFRSTPPQADGAAGQPREGRKLGACPWVTGEGSSLNPVPMRTPFILPGPDEHPALGGAQRLWSLQLDTSIPRSCGLPSEPRVRARW